MLQIGRRWGVSSVSKLEPLLCFSARVPQEALSPQGGSCGEPLSGFGLGSSPAKHSCGLIKPALLGPPCLSLVLDSNSTAERGFPSAGPVIE